MMTQEKMPKHAWTIALLLIVALAFGNMAYADALNSSINAETLFGLNVVILIDRSGSMRRSDSKDLSQEAAKQLIDICELKHTCVAVLGFNHELISVNGGQEITDEASRKSICAAIDRLPSSKTLENEDTDIGQALEHANEILIDLTEENPQRMNAVLLISDGGTDFGDSIYVDDESAEQKAIANSQLKADSIAHELQAKGTPIYCIALQRDGYEDAREDLRRWADETNEKLEEINMETDQYQLAEIALAFYTDMIRGDMEEISGNTFKVVQGVYETNIVITPAVYKLLLTNPYGKRIDIDGAANIVVSADSQNHTSIKLIEPQAGDWTIYVDPDATKLKVDSYSLHLELASSDESLNKNKTAEITARFIRNNKPFIVNADVSLLQIDDTGNIQTYEMEYDIANQLYYFEMKGSKRGRFTLMAEASAGSEKLTSNAIRLDVKDSPLMLNDAEYKGVSQPITIDNWQSDQEYVLLEMCDTMFRDADGDPLSKLECSIEATGGIAKLCNIMFQNSLGTVAQTNRSVTIKGIKQPGEGVLTLTATGDDGTVVSAKFDVEVKCAQAEWIEEFIQTPLGIVAIFIVTMILVLLARMRLISRKTNRFESTGKLFVKVMGDGDGKLTRLALAEIPLNGSGKFNLGKAFAKKNPEFKGMVYINAMKKIEVKPVKNNASITARDRKVAPKKDGSSGDRWVCYPDERDKQKFIVITYSRQ